MSWFDAAGLANIAKSVLKDAQRTIDKALDIKDDDMSSQVPSNTPVDPNSDDFFSTWGITQSGNVTHGKKEIISDSTRPQQKLVGGSSIWGSFTGSFFDTTQEPRKSGSFDSLEDSIDAGAEHFSQSKLVVQHSDDGDSQMSRLSISEELVEDSSDKTETLLDASISNVLTTSAVVVNKNEKQSSHQSNRLSVISLESGKNSSESVDIMTCSTECTTSPESDLLSVSRSSSGLKQTSESVEILGESLTSPSSVEVLGSEVMSSRRQSQLTDEFVSPLESPMIEDKSSTPKEKISPDSVEVIPEDQDENSVEDTMSYTSVSESTVLDSPFNVHLKPQKMFKDNFNRTELLTDSLTEISLSSDPITRAPSRSTMHLPLTQINQVLIDTQPQSTNQDMSTILNKINVIDIPQDNEMLTTSDIQLDSSIDEGSQSDKTLIGTDSLMESSSDTSTTTETSSNSTYLKNMLADAMTEKQPEIQNTNVLESISISQLDMPPRDSSPISSESRSDLVKIGSDHTSAHTSGDELETTTSSDIEIISSPNGDSSSTQSRQSPAKQTCSKEKTESSVDALLCKMTMKKAKGHTRELSEASSISDDSHSTEVDRLLKRISEMTDILESRESKLIDINRRYAELQQTNKGLQFQLDSVLTKQIESADLSQVTEEYTQRMSALEKKFQQAIREKDTLRKQLEQSKQEAAMRMTKGELELLISEKDEIIRELREEGEKLSKQQLQHSNIIKKLRAKEKENENTIKHLKENVEGLSAETDRLKRSLTAKEEVERSQIEAVHQLTAKNKKLESEVARLQSQLDDLTEKHSTVKKSLDAAKKELIGKNKANTELLATEQLLESLENEKKITESQNEEIISQLEDLRYKLRQSEQDYLKKEQLLRQENTELVHRLEDAEARNEELSQSILEVSKPLVRQLESLQATYNIKMANSEKIEQQLTLKISELQGRLQSLSNSERNTKEECVSIRSKLAELEAQLNSTNHKNDMLQMKLEQTETQKQIELQELKSELSKLNEELKIEKERIEEKDRLVSQLEHHLAIEKSTNELERKRNVLIQEHSTSKNVPSPNSHRSSPQNTGSNSPTLSLGKVSVSESFWSQQDEPFDVGQPPRYTNMFEMQMLQSSLKQRDGEVQQLQWELSRREQERSLLNMEISTLLTKVETLESKVVEYDSTKTQLSEVQQRCDALCQLYGEKVEENEELKLDLQDVKEMYKSQIDELLRQQKQQSNV